MNPETLKEMQEIDWWHNMELDGVMTNGRDYTQEKLPMMYLPKDLKGKSVIDVGAWDGFFSFECERRGAKDVLAIDTITWQEGPLWAADKGREIMHTGKKGFNFAHKILKSKVDSMEIEVMDLAKNDLIEKYDLVLCLGIMYHMEDPFGMCKVMYDLCSDDGMCIIETHMDCIEIKDKAVMAFYPDKQCNNDPGTWCGPNPQCVAGMLKAAGFKEVKMVFGNEQVHRGVFQAWKKKQ